MVRALAPTGHVPQNEQPSLVREVANATQTAIDPPQEALSTVNGPAAGVEAGSHAHSQDEFEAAGSIITAIPEVSDAAAAVPAAAADGAVKPAAKAEAVTKWVPSPYVSWLEWPEDANERRLSSGATAVVFR